MKEIIQAYGEKILELEVWEKQTFLQVQIKPGLTWTETFNNIELITSENFLDSIASGLWNKAPYWKSKGYKVKMCFPEVGQLNYEEKEELLEDLTLFQAVAIRKKNLENFIENLKIEKLVVYK